MSTQVGNQHGSKIETIEGEKGRKRNKKRPTPSTKKKREGKRKNKTRYPYQKESARDMQYEMVLV
jgi:hypothetical protein